MPLRWGNYASSSALKVKGESLRHVAACTAPHPMECPTFLPIVRLVRAGGFEP